MRNPLPQGVDLRGLHWPFEALERLRERVRDEAAAQVATLQRAHTEIREALARAQACYQEAVRALAAPVIGSLDLARHQNVLTYLADGWAQVAQKQTLLCETSDRLAQAQQVLATRDAQLAAVQRLRERAEQAYALEQVRRHARTGDLAWLVRNAAEGARRARSHRGAA